jgi:hypothetical protein
VLARGTLPFLTVALTLVLAWSQAPSAQARSASVTRIVTVGDKVTVTVKAFIAALESGCS